MASTFRGLEIGKTALTAASMNQSVTEQNISNANTVGYTRQRAVSQAKIPEGLNYTVSQIYNKRVGQGVTITDIQQIRSDYLDEQYRDENNKFSYYEYRDQGLSYLTGVMNELKDDGSITICLNDFSSALQKLSEDSTSQENRLNVQKRATSLLRTIKYVNSEMDGLWEDQNTSIKTVAASINAKAEQITVLNTAIANYEHSGSTANDLRDQRNNLLDELSSLANITYSKNKDDASMVDVQIGGVSLVNGKERNTIDVTVGAVNTYTNKKETALQLTDNLNSGTVYTLTSDENASGDVIQIDGGELYAHMELLTSTDSDVPGIPYYIDQLNHYVQDLAKMVNDVHQQGYTCPSTSSATSQTGICFFTQDGVKSSDVDLSSITAGNISLSKEVEESVWNIAASDKEIDLNSSSNEKGNANIATKLYNLFDENGEVYTKLNTIVGHLGIASDTNSGLLSTSKTTRYSVSKKRTSVCGVSSDEETTNLIKFQQSYSVASRMVTTIDDMLDTLINGTGRVGL